MDDGQLYELVRESLRERAGDVDTSPAAVARVMPPSRPHRARWVAAGAALAVAATVTAVAVLGDRASRPGGDPPPVAGDPVPVPSDWRAESWQGLTVSVPPDWGYGGAPMADGVACFPSAMKAADGSDQRDESGPYVGRPIAVTDVCAQYPFGVVRPDRQGGYVWLGAGIEPGTVNLGDGRVQQTVVAEGTTLTVATKDETLRAQILGSARPTRLCPVELPGPPEPARTSSFDNILTAAKGLTVCAYHAEAEGPVTLTYAANRDDVAADAWLALIRGRHDRLRCSSADEAFEWVVLRFEGTGEMGDETLVREIVVHLGGAGCPRVQLDSGAALVLSRELVEPWATGGIPAVVYGPTGGKGAMIDSFIGPQG
jgi:hypothetical protein